MRLPPRPTLFPYTTLFRSLFIWGMVIAHLGIAVALAGMASESAFTREKLVAARPGETVEVGPWSVRFDAVDPIEGPNWTDRKSTRLNSSHSQISYAVFCLK